MEGFYPLPPNFSLTFLLVCSSLFTPRLPSSFCSLTTSQQRCGTLLRKQVGTGWLTKAAAEGSNALPPQFPKSTYTHTWHPILAALCCLQPCVNTSTCKSGRWEGNSVPQCCRPFQGFSSSLPPGPTEPCRLCT